MNNKKTNEEEKFKWWYYLIFPIVVIVWALTFSLYFIINESDERGQFGDMFGAVNALFSGLAFAGLIITLILQKKELTLQRKELSQTRDEFKEQNKTMKLQRFENTFFNLLTMLEHITDNLECKFEHEASGEEKKYRGREVFDVLYQGEIGFEDGIKKYLKNRKVEDLFKYDNFKILNHYFKVLKGVLKYIDESNLLKNDERYQYAVILRNTLSDNELYLIFYYFVACRNDRYKIIAQKYTLFFNIDSNELAQNKHHNMFGEDAYRHRVDCL